MDLLIAPNTVPLAQADTAPLSGTPQWATNGNPATNTPATVLPAYAFNALQAELTNAIQAAGITLDRTKLTQLAAAIQAMTQGAKGNTALDTGTANAYAAALTPPITAYTPGMLVSLQSIKASNTGASTLALNGLAALPIQGPAGTALQGGELDAGFGALLRVNAAATAFELIQTTGGSLPVKAAIAPNQAVNLGQVLSALAFGAAAGGTGTSASATTANFTAPSTGYLAISAGYAWGPGVGSIGASLATSLPGMVQTDANLIGTFDQINAILPMTVGQSSTVTATVSQTSTVKMNVNVHCIFIPLP